MVERRHSKPGLLTVWIRQVCLHATRVVQSADIVVRQQGWLRRLVNSGIGDDDETACVVEAMIRCPDEESGKAVEDARRAKVSKTRSQRDKKMGR